MTFEVILQSRKNLHRLYVSNHTNFYQNRFIKNVLARKKLRSQSLTVSEFLSRFRKNLFSSYFALRNMLEKALDGADYNE